jgi:hypothetical protein
MIQKPRLTVHVAAMAKLFRERFDPSDPLQGVAYEAQRGALMVAIERSVNDEKEHLLLSGCASTAINPKP